MSRALLTPGRSTVGTDPGESLRLRLRLIGRMEALDRKGESVLPRARKTRALLALLALEAPRPVSRSRLAAMLWASRDREQARGSLRQALHELQQALGADLADLLWADRSQMAMASDGVWIDVHVMTRDLASAATALELPSGEVLSDLDGLGADFDAWLASERRRLRAAVIDAATRFLRSLSAPPEIEDAAARLLSVDPTNETGWRSLVAARLERGDRESALTAYEQSRAEFARAGRPPPTDLVPPTLAIALQTPGDEGRPDGDPTDESDAAASSRQPTDRAAARIRLGVFGLRPLGGPLADRFAPGLIEELAVALARLRWISCLTSAALGPSASEPHDPAEWRRLGVDVLLDGTVQCAEERVRVTLRLLDMRDGGIALWSRRFDHAPGDTLTIQEEIAGQAVAQIDSTLLMREGERMRARPPSPNATADELTLRAVPSVYRLVEGEFAEAGEMLRLAIQREPSHAGAHAWLAYWDLFLVGQGWAEEPQATSEEAGTLSDRALSLEPDDAHFITLAGHVRAFLARRPEEGIALHRHAINLNPNLPMAWAFLGLAQTYLGLHDEGLVSIEQATRLSPVDPHGFFFEMALTMPHLLKRNYSAVVDIGRRAIQLNPAFSSAYKGFLAALGHLGLTSEAERVRTRLLRIEPRLTLADAVRRSPMQRDEDVAHYAEGLRLAGLS